MPNWLQKQFWTRIAKPAEDRALFQHLVSQPVSSILEVGIGVGHRMKQISKLVQLPADVEQLKYIGTDEFEAASDGQNHLSLKQAHQIAGSLGYKATLIPGDIQSAIPRVAHKMGTVDVIVADGSIDPLAPLNSFLGQWGNHIAHEGTMIFACAKRGSQLEAIAASTLLAVEEEYRKAA